MNPFRRARSSFIGLVICIVIAGLMTFVMLMGRGKFNDLMWGIVALAGFAGFFFGASVVENYLIGCQDSLNALERINDQLESISTAVNSNNGREGDP